MRPVLLSIPVPLLGTLSIPAYGVMLAIGALIGLQAAIRLGRRRSMSDVLLVDSTLVAITAGIAGARIFYVIQFWSEQFAWRPFYEVFAVWHGGLVFYGGLIGATLATLVFLRVKGLSREEIWGLADCAAVGVVLGLAFGRIGCFLNGCCFGRPTDSCLGVTFPPGSPVHEHQLSAGLVPAGAACARPVLPSQLFESAAALAIFLVLYLVVARVARTRGLVALWGLALYPVARFLVELTRNDNLPLWGGALGSFTVGQVASAVILAAAVPALVLRWRRGPKMEDAPGRSGGPAERKGGK